MSNFSPDKLMEVLRIWAARVDLSLTTGGIYLFGSSTFRNWQRFEQDRSDIDLLVIMPDALRSAPERADFISRLQNEVATLELELLKPLSWSAASKAICSVVVATWLEIEADVHKSNVSAFFSRNTFRPLHEEGEDGPLPNAGSRRDLAVPTREAIALAQKVRNLFLKTTPNGQRELKDWSDTPVVPKEIARSAAGLADLTAPGVPGDEFDTRLGTTELAHWLYSNRSQSTAYYRLHDWLSARQNGGSAEDDPKMLTPEQYLLMGEIVYEIARERLGSSRLSGAVTTAAVSIPLAQEEPLESIFEISDSDHLAGEDEDLELAVAAATSNLAYRIEPAFKVAFTEAASLAEAIAAGQGKGDHVTRRALIAATDRQRALRLRIPTYESGFRFILFYQNLLFSPSDRQVNIRVALRAFAERALIPHRAIGGFLVGWNELADRRAVQKFSLGPDDFGEYMADQGIANPLEIAAENPDLTTIREDLLARYFVPELVYDHVANGHATPDESAGERDLFTMRLWRFGLI